MRHAIGMTAAAAIIIMASCGESQAPNDWQLLSLQGNVCRMSVTREDAANGLFPMFDDCETEIYFDPSGYIESINGIDFIHRGDSIEIASPGNTCWPDAYCRRWQDGRTLHVTGWVAMPQTDKSRFGASATFDRQGRVTEASDNGLVGELLDLNGCCNTAVTRLGYDDDGRFPVSEETEATIGGEEISYAINYTYEHTDSMGNWTMRTARDAATGTTLFTERRKLTYRLQ